jgi:hypothetical protein
MTSRRICLSAGPCWDQHVSAGGLAGRPPRALWAVRAAEGDVGCIAGEPGHPPALLSGEHVLGCYEYDPAADGYNWRPAAPAPGQRRLHRPGVCPDSDGDVR